MPADVAAILLGFFEMPTDVVAILKGFLKCLPICLIDLTMFVLSKWVSSEHFGSHLLLYYFIVIFCFTCK